MSPYPRGFGPPPGLPPQMMDHAMWQRGYDIYGGGMPHQMMQNHHRTPPSYSQQLSISGYPSLEEEGRFRGRSYVRGTSIFGDEVVEVENGEGVPSEIEIPSSSENGQNGVDGDEVEDEEGV